MAILSDPCSPLHWAQGDARPASQQAACVLVVTSKSCTECPSADIVDPMQALTCEDC